jgi:superfamily II DNA or RNA helicase
MPTGAGKTRTAMNLIAHFARHRLAKDELVIWLAHSEELCEQAAEEFEESWNALGIRNLRLHRCFGSHKVDLSTVDSGILVGGLQMMFSQSQRNQSEFLKIARKAKLVIMDEAHQAIAPTYQHILDMLAADPSTAVLGLSATPGRSTFDAMEDIRLAEFFARQKVTLEVDGYESPVDFLQKEGYLAAVNYERIKYSPSGDFELSANERLALQRGLVVPASVLKRLGADERRNLLVLSRIIEEAEDPSRKIIVFACSVDHARLIANILL